MIGEGTSDYDREGTPDYYWGRNVRLWLGKERQTMIQRAQTHSLSHRVYKYTHSGSYYHFNCNVRKDNLSGIVRAESILYL